MSQRCAGNIRSTDSRDQRAVWLCSSDPRKRPLSVFTAKAWLPASRARQLQVIPSQQKYWLKRWQRLIWNILVTMSGCVILLSRHPAWFMGLVLLLFAMSLLQLIGLAGTDISWKFPILLCRGSYFSWRSVRQGARAFVPSGITIQRSPFTVSC